MKSKGKFTQVFEGLLCILTVTLHTNKVVFRIFFCGVVSLFRKLCSSLDCAFSKQGCSVSICGHPKPPQNMCRSIALGQFLVQILVAE